MLGAVMKQPIIRLLCILSLLPAAMADPVTVLVPPDVWADYQQLVDGRDPLDITDFSGPGSRRDVVEVILMQQALDRARSDFELRFETEADYAKTLDALVQGTAIASATSAWMNDLTERWEDLYITTAVIERGQFEAGFYTPQANRDALTARSDGELRRLKGVSSRNWVIDWQTLNAFGARVTHADTWGEMVDAVFAGEQDYLLAPFQRTEDMALTLEEGTLVPIPGVKIGLTGSRHFAISRSHPEGSYFNASLHLGLMRLKKEGVVTRAYEDAGFINRQVADWRPVEVESTITSVWE